MNLRAEPLQPDTGVSGQPWTHRITLVALVVAMAVTAGCSTRRVSQPAPVEDRAAARPLDAAVKTLPGAENAGKPGYYTVKPGDTLYRIALESGQAWRDLQAWNNLANPNLIEVGQVLRVAPPVAPAPAAGPVAVAPVPSSSVVGRPIGQPNGSTTTTPAAPAVTPAPAAVPSAETPPAGPDDIAFVWPAQGAVIANFDESRNIKGVSIGGKPGDPVLAAADGRVVYAGAGLRGYGNLVILKHNNTYLTAYAHNQALLVREDQMVQQGQRIAEMGSSDTDRVKLHFEVRRQGKPVDPLNHLPRR